ncbi:MAG: uridine kinase [Clostridium sp.]|uniref:uridine kinase n=1 Tax=Clostridium sp. TaxID=1506 RepID=UPI003039CFF1
MSESINKTWPNSKTNPVYKNYFQLFSYIDELLSVDKTITIAIEGPSGSGKSSLASIIKSIYDCNVFHMDDFFLPAQSKTKERLSEPGGNVDYLRFKKEVSDNLKLYKPFKYQLFSCKLGELTDFVCVTPKKLNIIEGVYSLHPTFDNIYDLKIFLSIDEETQLNRILKRNGEFMLQRFKNEWIPLENNYFTKLDISSKCDLVIMSQ